MCCFFPHHWNNSGWTGGILSFIKVSFPPLTLPPSHHWHLYTSLLFFFFVSTLKIHHFLPLKVQRVYLTRDAANQCVGEVLKASGGCSITSCLWTGLISDLCSRTVHSCCIKEWERGMLVTRLFFPPPLFFYKLVESLFHPNESNSPLLLVTLHFSHYLRLSFQGISNPELHLQHSSQRGRLNTQCWFLQILQFDDSLNQWCVREGVSVCVPMVSAAGYNVSSTWNVTLTRLSASGSTVVCKSSGEQFAQSQNHTYLILHPPPTRWDPLVLIWSCWQGGQWLVGEEKKKQFDWDTHLYRLPAHTSPPTNAPEHLPCTRTHTHLYCTQVQTWYSCFLCVTASQWYIQHI